MKRLMYCFVCMLFIGEHNKIESCNNDENNKNFDYLLNMRVSHERQNQYFFGSENRSCYMLNPIFKFGNVIINSDFYYGKSCTFTGAMSSFQNFSRLTSYEKQKEFYDKWIDRAYIPIKNTKKAIADSVNKERFYRTYSSAIYRNDAANINYIFGDVMSNNPFGLQRALSGVGLSIFKTTSTKKKVNMNSPIILTRISKVECILGDESLGIFVLAPGRYTIENLPEEAKIPGITLKITDQMSRSEKIDIDYFGQYNILEKGKEDFDVIIVNENYWNIDAPNKMNYLDSPKISANYRYGYRNDFTLTAYIQGYRDGAILGTGGIYFNQYGIFGCDVGLSYDRNNFGGSNAVGFNVFYKIPPNSIGLFLEAGFSVKSSGFSTIGQEYDNMVVLNKIIDKYRLDNNLKNGLDESSSKSLTVRVYSRPLWDCVVPAFTFNGEWRKTKRLREYTLSATTKLKYCTVTMSVGLTYDDPNKGFNGKSPDRRLLLSCVVPVGKEIEVKGFLSSYGDETNKNYMFATYKPRSITGLEISVEQTSTPGRHIPKGSIKYSNQYIYAKAENTIRNTYENSNAQDGHSNSQKFIFGTSLFPKGIRNENNVGFNSMHKLISKKKLSI